MRVIIFPDLLKCFNIVNAITSECIGTVIGHQKGIQPVNILAAEI